MSTRLLSSALLLTSALVSPAALAEPKYPATVDVFGGVTGDGPGGGLELIAPFAEGEGSLLFGLARGSLWDETGGGGIGLGYRTQALPGFILGGYGMVDYHHGASNEGYFQGLLGLEALTESFDFRINGYLPENDETMLANITGAAPPPPSVTVGEIVIVDHEIGMVSGATAGIAGIFRQFEQPLPGIDAEIGYRLPIPGQDFRLFVGAFHFEGGNDYENVTGPKARAEWRIHDLDLFGNNSRLTLEAGIRDDDVRGTDASAGVRIRIPFGGVPSNQRGHELAGLDQRMLDPIRREDHIVTGERQEMQAGTPGMVTIEAVRAVETGNEITSIWFADGAGGGDGTQGNETDLATAVTDPGAGDQVGRLIVAYGGSGNLTGNVTLAVDQILLGGTTPLAIQGITSGNLATYDPLSSNPMGARPTIIDGAAGASPIVTLADGDFVTGVDLAGTNDLLLANVTDAALFGNGADDLIIRDVTVSDAGAALVLLGGTNAMVEDFTASTTAMDGLASNAYGIFANGATGGSYTDIELMTFEYGLVLESGSSGTVTTALLEDTGFGFRLSQSTATVTTLTVNDSFIGVDIADSTSATLSDIDVDGSGNRGISIVRSSGVSLDQFTISNTIGNGLTIQNTPMAATGTTVTVSNGTLTNNGGGMVAQSDVLLVQTKGINMSNVTSSGYLTSAGNQAAIAVSQSSDVTLDNVDVNGLRGAVVTTRSGIGVGNSSQNVTITGSDVSNVVTIGVTIAQSTDVMFQGGATDPFSITNAGSTGLYITNATNVTVQDGAVTDTGALSAFMDVGGILAQGTVGTTTQVTLSNIDVIRADSASPNAYGVGVMPGGTPTTVNVTLNDVDVDGGAGMVTTRGFNFVVGIGGSSLTVSGTGNNTANVADSCQFTGVPIGTVQIDGVSEPGTNC